MTHHQAVFLGHWMPTIVIFWVYCQYYSIKTKRALRRSKRLKAQEKLLIYIIPQSAQNYSK